MGFLNDLFGAKNNNFASADIDNGPGGFANQASTTQGQQGALFNMLMSRANGTGGPSAAEQMLNRSTNQQIGQEASAIGGVKGINPALAAKMISENSAARLQDTAGQAGIQRANEQMGAQNTLAGALGQERGRQTQESLGVQGINAQVGAGNAGQNASTAGGILGGVGSLLGLADGGEVPEQPKGDFDVAEVHIPQINQTPTPLTGGGDKGGGGGMGSLVSAALPLLMAASKGGEIPEFIQKFAGGGSVVPNFGTSFASGYGLRQQPGDSDAPEAKSHGLLGNALMSLFSPSAPDTDPSSSMPTSYDYATMYGAPGGAGGGNNGMPTSQDYANMYGAPGATEKSNMFAGAADFKARGGKIPGKAEVEGDSPKNDTVPIMASPGEVVLPRTSAKDPEKAAEFVEALNKQREKKSGGGGYADVLRAQEAMHNRLAQIEKFCYGGRAA